MRPQRSFCVAPLSTASWMEGEKNKYAIDGAIEDGPREHLETRDEHHLVGCAVQSVAHVVR